MRVSRIGRWRMFRSCLIGLLVMEAVMKLRNLGIIYVGTIVNVLIPTRGLEGIDVIAPRDMKATLTSLQAAQLTTGCTG